MKIGISQLVLPNLSLEEFFAKSAAAGYEVVELCMKRTGELTPETDAAGLRRIADLACARGLAIVSMCHSHCTGNLLDSGEAQRRSIDETVAGLRAAAALGARCTLHTLGRPGPDLYYDDAYRNGVASLREIARTAEALDVCVAVEFVWNGFLFSPLEMDRFLRECCSPQIGFYFDPGNMAVFHFPHHWARILGPRIRMMHAKDWTGSALKDGGWPALLKGSGRVDWPAILRELRAAGYTGPIISEVGPGTASLEETAESIRKIIAM